MTLHKLSKSKIELEEGWEPLMYECPAGYLTIGYGFNLETSSMPKRVADLWVSIIVKSIDERLSKIDCYKSLNEARKVVLIDMSYQMGVDGLMRFKNMWKAIENKDYELASIEMLDSLWAKQTVNRANRNAQIMRSGDL